MLEEYVKSLVSLYQKDLEDYRELLQRMKDYYSFLSSTENAEAAKIADGTEDSEDSRDIFQQKLEQFATYRKQIFHNLQQRAKQAQELETKITALLGTGSDILALEPYLPASLYSELITLAERLGRQMAEILELDEKIIPLLNQELKAIKSELHRIQGLQKTRNAYEPSGQREARFIDKIK